VIRFDGIPLGAQILLTVALVVIVGMCPSTPGSCSRS
jgi:hypothetical protein